MHPRKALLKRLATVSDWEAASHANFEGESWLQSRNTVFRFRDGICLEVASRDRARGNRAGTLLGMRLLGWVVGEGRVFTDQWAEGACAVLWRAGGGGTEESMAMTSATTSFARGRSPLHLQALHDHAPPAESQAFRRAGAAPALRPALREEDARPRLPSSSSYRSG
jgi:hypothetical protein